MTIAPPEVPTTWTLTARRTTTWLAGVVVALTLANAVVTVARRNGSDLRSHAGLFDVDFEQNVPTWFSAVLLLLAAVLMVVVSAQPAERSDRRRWWLLAVLAVAMSIDEVAVYHELWITPTRTALGTGGALYFAWVVPALALVGVVAVSQVRFLARLPRPTAVGLALSAGCYVTGAVGFEMLSAVEGQQQDFRGFDGLRYDVVVAVEELLEMIGVLGAVHTLLRHLERRGGALRIGFG